MLQFVLKSDVLISVIQLQTVVNLTLHLGFRIWNLFKATLGKGRIKIYDIYMKIHCKIVNETSPKPKTLSKSYYWLNGA